MIKQMSSITIERRDLSRIFYLLMIVYVWKL